MKNCYFCTYIKTNDLPKPFDDIVYQDSNGHNYCILHAPKYYITSKELYYGIPAEHNSTSKIIEISLNG